MEPSATLEGRLFDLKQRFVQTMPDRIAAIASTLAGCNDGGGEAMDRLGRQFHTLAGTAGTYDLSAVSAAAFEGEEACAELSQSPLDSNNVTYLNFLVDQLRGALAADTPGQTTARTHSPQPIRETRPVSLVESSARCPLSDGAWGFSPASLAVRSATDFGERLQRDPDKRICILAQGAFDGVCIHRDGKIVGANDSFLAITGYMAEELFGMPFEFLVSVEERANALERSRSHDSSRYESCILRKDGTTLQVEVCGASVPGGERVVSIRDTSERRASKNALLASEERFRDIIENASDLIAIIERDGRIRYHSPSIERVLEITAESVVGKLLLDLVHPDDVEKASQFLEHQIAEPAANGMVEIRLHHRNASWRSFEVVARNLITAGDVTAMVTNARDITDRKLLEAQLAQAHRLSSLGRLAATVAHEFNNVLMGMQPFAELMLRPNAAPSMISKGAWHISNSIQRGKRITMDILRFTQPAQPVTAMVDVGEWWEMYAPEAEIVLGNVVRLVSRIQYRGTCVVADKEQLSQVMANLVANARDAMPAGGTLTVQAFEPPADSVFAFGIVADPERFIQISVSDTGQGITAEVMPQIFDPLFTTKRNGGTGLGLAVSHQVMTQHGGYIFAESEVARGTTFHLFFPKGVAPCEKTSAVQSQRQDTHGRTLLMIEDEELIVKGVKALLSGAGMNVVAVGTGGEAAAAIAKFNPDVVLLDLGLPDMDGAEVYTLLRKRNPLLPVIFASGHGDQRALRNGMTDARTRFLQKPFEMEALLEMIAELDPRDSHHE